jgi:murein DD-endopeptidase MepM/ murein hydrolase activator NlpD
LEPQGVSYQSAGGPKYVIYKPFKGNYPVTQGYHSGHEAIDWGMPNGTTLYNPFPQRSQVVFSSYTGDGYAYNIRLRSNEYKLTSLFAHLNGSKGLLLRVGEWATPGQPVAKSDNTGNSTGPHLHMEIRGYPYGYDNTTYFWPYLVPLPQLPPQPPTPTPRPTAQPTPPPGGSFRARVIQSCKIYSQPIKVKRYQIGKVAPPKIIVVSNYNASWVRYQNGYLRRVCMVRL